MKRTTKYALSAVLASAMVLPSIAGAQGYSDVPENHWAYDALVRLKREGLLVGYPDGEFKGKRLTTRYELAAAIYAVYMNLKNITDSLDGQIQALNAKVDGMTNGDPAALQALRDQLSALQNDVNAMKGYRDEIDTLKRLTDSFQKELQSLGVDVEAMKKDISDLDARVSRLEANKPSIKFSGDVNLYASFGFGEDGGIGVNQDGKTFGFKDGAPNAAGFEDLSVIHDLGLSFEGTNETGPKFKGTLVAGNGYATAGGPGFGSQSEYANFVNTGYTEGDTSVFLQNLEVEFPTSVGGVGFNARVGRIGYKVSPQILQRIDTTSFFQNDRWDNGLFALDGATIGFDFGGGKLDFVLARVSDIKTTQGGVVQNLLVGGEQSSFLAYQGYGQILPNGLNVQRVLGANFSTNIARTNGAVNVSYLLLDGDAYQGGSAASGQPINRAEVYGGDVSFGISKIKLNGSYSQINYKDDNGNALDTNNQYWSAGAKYAGDRFGVYGGYRYIEANYLAPGDWGRYGIIRNPTNVKGFNVGGSFRFTDALALNGQYEQLEAIQNSDGEIQKYSVNLTYDLPSGLKLMGGYEDTRFSDYAAGGDPTYRFATVGLGYNLNASSFFSLSYQYGDIDNDFVIGNGRGTGGSFSGSFIASQLSIKF